jgi:hypothetical protein
MSSDGSDGVLTVSCHLVGTSDAVFEGITATKATWITGTARRLPLLRECKPDQLPRDPLGCRSGRSGAALRRPPLSNGGRE